MTLTIQPEQAGKLVREVRTWLEHRGDLLRTARGKYVVIQGEQVFGVFADKAEAYAQAYQQFGIGPFLLRPIQDEEEVYYIAGSSWDSEVEGNAGDASETHTA